MKPNIENGKLLVNIVDAADILSIGRSTIYKLIDAGDLKVVKLRGSARVTMDSIRLLAGADCDAARGAA